ncbi:uncharacterized protein LOC134874818 isoform X2 [Eleginops maclovinus]|uniref:uncharacterized protein LOC134874818 isoform X2 n=1 Tax=Eleginops maclovinus TaxID=56733 RepID=UPI00308024BB
MDYLNLGCPVCLTTFKLLFDMKTHFHSNGHVQKMIDVFHQDSRFNFRFKGHGIFPHIELVCSRAKAEITQPIIGMSMCFSRESNTSFYLCHVCEVKCQSQRILQHISSTDHSRNYFCYINPNALNFSWIPNKQWRDVRNPEFRRKGSSMGDLQVLELPGNLFKQVERSTYSEVAHILSEIENLPKMNEVFKTERMTIQTYQKDSTREHPLLGMQHLIECICVGETKKRYYLCTLCKITVAAHGIIKHVLSFDHIFSYFKAWHPSTVQSKEIFITNTKNLGSLMLNFAKQTDAIHGTSNMDMKQVSLEPAKFSSIKSTSYIEVLKELESITKENNESSLMTVVKPGKKLVLKEPESITKEKDDSSSVTIDKQEKTPASKELESIKKENDECSVMTVVKPENKPEELTPSYKIQCQNCSWSYCFISQYRRHLSLKKHQEMVTTFVGKGWVPKLPLFTLHTESLKRKPPLIGVPLVMTFVCTQFQSEPFYMCFACEDCFSESSFRQHVDSTKHLIHTLLYQNPWRLTFAWKNCLDINLLRSMAWEEEKERGTNQRKLKILDVPYRMLQGLDELSYAQVMERFSVNHLKHGVPERETYSKLKQNERFPLLGSHFLVMYPSCVKGNPHTEKGFLCLLCERRLLGDECYAHVFSFDHVAKFLESFHPGSTNSSTDTEMLEDLAKQARCFHPISHVQVVHRDEPIWDPCSYSHILHLLSCTKWSACQALLKPKIKPGRKLVPRGTLKIVATRHVTGGQKSTEKSDTTLKRNPVKVGAEVTNTQFAKSGQSAETGNKQIPTPSKKESENRKEGLSKDGLEEIKSAGSETCPEIKKEKLEEPILREPISETPETCKNTDKKDETESGKERNKSCKDILKQKRINSHEDPCPVHDVNQEKKQTKGILSSKKDSSKSQKQVTATNQGGSGKPSQKAEKDESSSNVNFQQKEQLWQFLKKKTRHPVIGLSSLLELNCDERYPLYLCECCSLMIPEKDIISHVSGFYHQKSYLMKLQKLSPLPAVQQMNAIRHVAALIEQQNGHGEAQVVDIEEDIYDKISKQNFKSAIRTVKVLQDQYESPSTSAPSNVQSVDSSAAQHQLCSGGDDYQEVNMKVEDSDDSQAEASRKTAAAVAQFAGFTETTSKTSISSATTANLTVTHTTSTASISNTMSTTKSATSPKPLERITGAAANVTAKTSYEAAAASNNESMVVHGVACKTAPAFTMEDTSRNSENVSIAVVPTKTMVTSAANVKKSVQCEKTEAPEAPKLATNPTRGPSHDSTTPKVGIESSSKVEGRLAVGQLVRAQSVKSPESGDRDPILDQVPSHSILNKNEPVAYPGIQQSDIAAVKIGKHQDYQPPPAPGSAGRFTQSLDTRQQQERSGPELEDTSMKLEGFQKRATAVAKEQQNQTRSSQRVEHVSTQALAMFLTGESSHLSTYLSVQGSDRGPIIGLGFVWECQGISVSPFYLCESCEEMISHCNICEHMRSYDHHLEYIWMKHPDFLYFWDFEFLLNEMKQDIVGGIAQMLSKRERYNRVDAQCILLRPGAFEQVKSLSFSEALKLVKALKKDPKLVWRTSSTPQQKGTRQDTEKYHSEKYIGYLDVVQKRRVLSPLNVNSSSSYADSVVTPVSNGVSPVSPQEKPGPRDFQHQAPIPELQVKQAEVHLESPYSIIVGPKTSQTLSPPPRDQCPPTRKRPADESVKTLDRYGTSNPHLQDPLLENDKPAECSQPSSESTFESSLVNPATAPTLLSPEDQNAGLGSCELDESPEYRMNFDRLMTLVRKTKLNISADKSPLPNDENATSCTYNSSQRLMESRSDQTRVQITCNMPTKDVTQDPASAYSFEEMSPTSAAPVDDEKQLDAPHANLVLAANDSFLKGFTSTRGNLLSGGTEVQTVSTVLPSASFSDPIAHNNREVSKLRETLIPSSVKSPTLTQALTDSTKCPLTPS